LIDFNRVPFVIYGVSDNKIIINFRVCIYLSVVA
jgi:hypothetical protein